VRESGSLARRTVGDLVCSSRGTEKPAYEDLAKAGVCKPLPTERGSAPLRECLREDATPAPVLAPIDPRVFKIEEGKAYAFAIVALFALFA
jgi:hypothetical protein